MIPLAMFDQPWQWAFVLVVVLVLFGGSRIKDVMGSLWSGVRLFRNSLHYSAGLESDLQELNEDLDFAAAPRLAGQNLQGVPIYEGRLRIPPRSNDSIALRNLMKSVGTAFVLGLVGTILRWQNIIGGLCVLGTALTAICAFASGHELYSARRVRKRYGHLCSIDELASRAGTSELTYLLAAKERGIRPCCIIGGKEHYDLSDLGESSVLLRASEGATDDGALLRPAASRLADNPNLLSPVGRDEDSHS